MTKKNIFGLILLTIFVLSIVNVAASVDPVEMSNAIADEDLLYSLHEKDIDSTLNAKWKTHWNEERNAPQRIVGYHEPLVEANFNDGNSNNSSEPSYEESSYESSNNNSKSLGSIQSLAKKFLKRNEDNLKIEVDNLKLARAEEDSGTHYILFQQYHKDVLVYNSLVGLTIKDGNVVSINSDYFNVNLDSVQPKIDEKAALKIISKDLNSKAILVQKDLVIYQNKLAWIIELGALDDNLWEYIIDAKNGDILRKINKMENLTGKVKGKIFRRNPTETPVEVNFSHQYVAEKTGKKGYFYSGSGNNLKNSLNLKQEIDLTNATTASLEYKFISSTEYFYDNSYVLISTDIGKTWTQLKIYSGRNHITDWSDDIVDLTNYKGKKILLSFKYTSDYAYNFEGFYVDDINIFVDGKSVFNDTGDKLDNWNSTGFTVFEEPVTKNQVTTKADGSYDLTADAKAELYGSMEGPWVKVVNMKKIYSGKFPRSTHSGNTSWSWTDSDDSKDRVESNVFYHTNVIHDFFTSGDPFNITAMNYQMLARVGLGTSSCNAYYQAGTINFYPEGSTCPDIGLLGDVIYHEYTHGVVSQIYLSFPYFAQTGAMNEAFADYFANTITNDSCTGRGWKKTNDSCLRNSKNTKKYPKDMAADKFVHYNSQIFSGALWDLRESLGKEATDKLIVRTMKMQGKGFIPFLEDMLTIDDNNGDLSDGTPNTQKICKAFYDNHGIFSKFCKANTDVITDFIDMTDVAIIDSGFIERTITVPIEKAGKIRKVMSFVQIDHALESDLVVDLTSPDGTKIKLHDLTSGIINGWYDSEILPKEDLSAFNGKEAMGTWKLRVTDTEAGDIGTLKGWKLYLLTDQNSPITSLNYLDPTPKKDARNIGNKATIKTDVSQLDIQKCVLTWNGVQEDMTFADGSCSIEKDTKDGLKYSYKVTAIVKTGGTHHAELRSFLENTMPTADIALTPETPKTLDDLKCDVTKLADLDDDDTGASWTWFKNGVEEKNDDAKDISIISKDKTKKGEEWKCQVTIYDGFENIVSNKIVTIANTAPVLEKLEDHMVVSGHKVTLNLAAFDADEDVLTYSVDHPKFVESKTDHFSWEPTYSDVGDWSITWNANDGTDKTSQTLNLQVKGDLDVDGQTDDVDDDDDDDGIKDTEDSFTGKLSDVKTNLENLSVGIDSDKDLTKKYTGIKEVTFYENTKTRFALKHDFTLPLNLAKLTIMKQTGKKGSLLVSGFDSGVKGIVINRLNKDKNEVCFHDDYMFSLNKISSSCDLGVETLLVCDGNNDTDSFSCDVVDDTYEIIAKSASGLRAFTVQEQHELIVVQAPTPPPDNSGGSSGGSSGGGGGSSGGGSSGGGGGSSSKSKTVVKKPAVVPKKVEQPIYVEAKKPEAKVVVDKKVEKKVAPKKSRIVRFVSKYKLLVGAIGILIIVGLGFVGKKYWFNK